MKIGYFITRYPYKDRFDDTEFFERYKYGGAEVAAYYLVNNMAQKGHEIKVFTTSANSKSLIEKYNNIEIHRYGTNFKIEKGSFSFNLFWKTLRYDVDIVHTHFTTPPGDLAGLWYAKRKKDIPFVVTYHGDGQENYGRFIRRVIVSFHNKYLVDKILSYADVIISPSEYYINESKFLRKYRDKIIGIPYGINLGDFDVPYSKEECREKLGLPIDKNLILFVGNLIPYKGPDILVKAMPIIAKEVPDIELVFVGSGKMRSELEDLSKKLGVEKNVRFAGFIGDVTIKTLYYKAADVFCLPSTMSTESFGIVNLEAMACNVPIVASKIGGIPGVVTDGENGLLVPPRDSEALADAIIYLLENGDVREKMGKNGREKVEDYSWEKNAEEMEKVYKRVISE